MTPLYEKPMCAASILGSVLHLWFPHARAPACTHTPILLASTQVAIGAIGKISRVPRFASTLPPQMARVSAGSDSDAIVSAHVMTMSWAADHRVVEGATIARFSNAWKALLEEPLTMLAHLR